MLSTVIPGMMLFSEDAKLRDGGCFEVPQSIKNLSKLHIDVNIIMCDLFRTSDQEVPGILEHALCGRNVNQGL